MYANPVDSEVVVADVAKHKGAPKVWSPMEGPTERERLKDLCKVVLRRLSSASHLISVFPWKTSRGVMVARMR